MNRNYRRQLLAAAALAACGAPANGALPPPPAGVTTFVSQGIEFSRVQASGVPPIDATGLASINRVFGGGDWDFGLARTELTQRQFIELPNAFNAIPVPSDQPWSDSLDSLLRGNGWAGPGTFSTGVGPLGRLIFAVNELGGVLPVTGMSFFNSAVYCNWLHNDRALTIDALVTGAYDLRGWDSFNPATWPTITRSPDAEFWIPAYDEWAVGAFYDLDRFGEGQAGWWPYLDRRTRLAIPGPPGVGETSFGWDTEPSPVDSFLVPVGSYPDSQSAWGLFDASGSRYEALEDRYEFDRLVAGTMAGVPSFPELEARLETPGWIGSGNAAGGPLTGLRVATAMVPGPTWMTVVVLSGYAAMPRRRRS